MWEHHVPQGLMPHSDKHMLALLTIYPRPDTQSQYHHELECECVCNFVHFKSALMQISRIKRVDDLSNVQIHTRPIESHRHVWKWCATLIANCTHLLAPIVLSSAHTCKDNSSQSGAQLSLMLTRLWASMSFSSLSSTMAREITSSVAVTGASCASWHRGHPAEHTQHQIAWVRFHILN